MDMIRSDIKFLTQRKILIVSALLLIIKFVAYLMTNSISILTDAMESIVNVLAGIFSLYSVWLSSKPKDDNHPFGHGKIELLSASVEASLIILAGLIIIYEAVARLFMPVAIERLDTGIVIVASAGITNYLLGRYSIMVGRRHNSIALIAGGEHLKSDTYSTIGLVVGLILLYFTNIGWLDSAIAAIFGFVIIYTGVRIIKETSSNLMDEADFKAISDLREIIRVNRKENWVSVHNLRLVKYGELHHIDCDLALPRYLNIVEAHMETEILRDIIQANYSVEVDANIHIDSCTDELCASCIKQNCTIRVSSDSL